MAPEDSLIAAHVSHLATLLRHSAKRMYGQAAGVGATEYSIMTMLVRGEQTIGQICARLDRDKSHVSRDIAALVARGLVTKGRGAVDARQIVVRLSLDAGAVRDAMIEVTRERVKRLTAGLSAEDLEAFQRVLTVMIHNAQDMRNDL
jgi:DNA-binding MarR family transcriptional regulator